MTEHNYCFSENMWRQHIRKGFQGKPFREGDVWTDYKKTTTTKNSWTFLDRQAKWAPHRNNICKGPKVWKFTEELGRGVKLGRRWYQRRQIRIARWWRESKLSNFPPSLHNIFWFSIWKLLWSFFHLVWLKCLGILKNQQ